MGFAIVGREEEQNLLHQIYSRESPDFLAVYGRRRVGKTYLINHFFQSVQCVFFSVTGIKDSTRKVLIERFMRKVGSTFSVDLPPKLPKNWLEAFEVLTDCIERVSSGKKIVLFFDELPWLAVPKSKFIQALDYFWNAHWQNRKNLKLIVCGSAASWMLENLIHAKGGLHNRITAKMSLRPFSLSETEKYLQHRKVRFNRRQILELYMAMGGVPHYLNAVRKDLSPAQNINQICFTKDGLLFTEFNDLFSSLFKDSPAHIELVRLIAKSRNGIDREELLKKAKRSSSGGRFKSRLLELEEAGFITSFIPYMRRKKGIFYRVIDEYTLFYLQWIEPVASHLKMALRSSRYWESKAQSPSWKAWSGYAFEAACFKHIEQIKEALKIEAIASEMGSWRHTPRSKKESGVQIDLLIDRADGIINLCEMKYAPGSFVITKSIAEDLKRKLEIYQAESQSRKTILLTLITPYGLHQNDYATQLVANEVTLNDLFRA